MASAPGQGPLALSGAPLRGLNGQKGGTRRGLARCPGCAIYQVFLALSAYRIKTCCYKIYSILSHGARRAAKGWSAARCQNPAHAIFQRPEPLDLCRGVRGGAGGFHQLGGHRVPGRPGVWRHARPGHLLDVGAGPGHGPVFAGPLIDSAAARHGGLARLCWPRPGWLGASAWARPWGRSW